VATGLRRVTCRGGDLAGGGRQPPRPQGHRPKGTALYQWRYLGTGLKSGRGGRHVRYELADVIAWFREQQGAAA